MEKPTDLTDSDIATRVLMQGHAVCAQCKVIATVWASHAIGASSVGSDNWFIGTVGARRRLKRPHRNVGKHIKEFFAVL